MDEHEYRRLLCRLSLGYAAYHTWAQQARRERRYNIARLLFASSNVKRIRAERTMHELGEVGTTSDNIARALAGLEPEAVATGPVTGTSPLSRELMGRAARALAENRDLTSDELADLYVCGTCGELMEGMAPIACAMCGTVREGFLNFRIAESMGALGPNALVKALEGAFTTIAALFDGLSDEMLADQRSGVSLKELLGHLIDMDIVFRERAWLILDTDHPRLPNGHPPNLAGAVRYRNRFGADLLDAFQLSRQQTLVLLRGLTRDAWHRIGIHAVYGKVPLLHQGNWVVDHERGHMVEMAQIRHNLAQQGDGTPMVRLPQGVIPEALTGE